MRELLMLRHGVTEANERRVFTGAQDIPLSKGGKAALAAQRGMYPAGVRYFTSGMLRARQTLEILYGGVESVAIDELAEYKFGAFEGRGHEELFENEPVYREWLDAGREDIACPGGETRAAFKARVTAGLRALAAYDWDGLAVLIAHGGVIATLMGTATHQENGCGWRVRLDDVGRIVAREAFP